MSAASEEQNASRDRKRVLIAGAGVAALEAALALEHLAGDAVEVCTIAPTREFTYRPLAVGEPFGRSEVARRPIADLLGRQAGGHVLDRIAAVSPDEGTAVTASGLSCAYDALLVATGARARDALPGALAFGGPASVDAYLTLLEEVDAGRVLRLVFALPRECPWGLPLYELALMTAGHVFERRIAGVELTLLTHETAPLAAFGPRGSEAVAGLLARQGIELVTGSEPVAFVGGQLLLQGGQRMFADDVVTVPRLEGPRLPGLPHDADGFIPVDEHGRVRGVERVWAAGDVTDRPLKQGGLAAQQADAAAESIAAWAGVAIDPAPYRPVLRGLLLAGDEAEYLRADRDPHGQARHAVRDTPLWWPPGKIAGRYLAPVLAAHGMDRFTTAQGPVPTDA